MDIILYAAETSDYRERLQRSLEGLDAEIQVFHHLQDFERRLSRTVYDIGAAVVLAETDMQLQALLALRRPLLAVPLVLIVPNFQEATTCIAHLLRPRYLQSAACDPSQIRPVLERICRKVPGHLKAGQSGFVSRHGHWEES